MNESTPTTEIVKVNASEYGLEESKALEVSQMFKPMLDKMVELETQFNDLVVLERTKENCALAKELRMSYVKVRTGTAAIHKDLKDFYLKGGRFVDAWKNTQIAASQGKEAKLKEIEDHFFNIEKEKINKIAIERTEMLNKYGVDIVPKDIGYMEQPIWDNLLAGAKHTYDLRIEAERKEEETRLAAEKKKLTYESRKDKLIPYSQFGLLNKLTQDTTEEEFKNLISAGMSMKADFDKEQLQIKKENERLQLEKKIADEKAAENKRIAAQEREIAQATIKKEQEEKRQLDLKLKKIEEEKAAKEKAAQEKRQLDLAKGDGEKVSDLIQDIASLKDKYNFESNKYLFITDDLQFLIEKLRSI